MRFVVTNTRGYITQPLDVTDYIGRELEVSIYVEDCAVSANSFLVLNGDVNSIRNTGRIPEGFTGRITALYLITGANVQLRFGGGCTSNQTADVTLSRPMVGDEDLPYMANPTGAVLTDPALKTCTVTSQSSIDVPFNLKVTATDSISTESAERVAILRQTHRNSDDV